MKVFLVEAVNDKEQFIVIVNEKAPKDWYSTNEDICETAEEYANRECQVVSQFERVLDFAEYAVFAKQ